MVVSWILNTIEPAFRSTITHMEIAKNPWEDIQERFSVANGSQVQQIKGEITEWKQRGLPIVTYYRKLEQLWEELANYEQMPTCQCGRCVCNLSVQLDKKREGEKLHQFLLGLDDMAYGTVRSNILGTEPLPSVGGRRLGTEIKDRSALCSYCNRSRQDAVNCFQLIGYPNGGVIRPKEMDASSSSAVAAEREHTAQGLLNGEQWAAFLSLLNSCKPSTNEKLSGNHYLSWIIDSGASHYMTGSLECLSELKDLMGYAVGLSDGNQTMTLKEGSARLRKYVKSKKVLYVPNLNCN
ncbi:uncharacterized protein [Coffea arabica]|uniref:Retrovirus-related Pol polyprotein from transposon TNT 1-94-like beta-barrel domain-containing protein n=1 Tax=Coffea arabica TaxID=13443 RepID=A0ABM4UFB2_COFAR